METSLTSFTNNLELNVPEIRNPSFTASFNWGYALQNYLTKPSNIFIIKTGTTAYFRVGLLLAPEIQSHWKYNNK